MPCDFTHISIIISNDKLEAGLEITDLQVSLSHGDFEDFPGNLDLDNQYHLIQYFSANITWSGVLWYRTPGSKTNYATSHTW